MPARHPGAARRCRPLGLALQPHPADDRHRRHHARRAQSLRDRLSRHAVALWLAYLAVALFFYFGDAFSADRRNNAMLFWKSMPVSDLKILRQQVARRRARCFRRSSSCVGAGHRAAALRLSSTSAPIVVAGHVLHAGRSTLLASFGQITPVRRRLFRPRPAVVRAVPRLGRRPVDDLRPLEPAARLRHSRACFAVIENIGLLRPGTARRLCLGLSQPAPEFRPRPTAISATSCCCAGRPFDAATYHRPADAATSTGCRWASGSSFAVARHLARQRISPPPHRLMRE